MSRPSPLLSATAARSVEWGIIALSLVSMGLVFQPWSLAAFGVGAALVVVSGLAFNLVPHCVAGLPRRSLVRVSLVVLTVLVVAVALAVASAFGYVWYLQAR